MATAELAIVADGLRRTYGGFEAVRGVALHLRRGELLALLGTNGAARPRGSRCSRGCSRRPPGGCACSGWIRFATARQSALGRG